MSSLPVVISSYQSSEFLTWRKTHQQPKIKRETKHYFFFKYFHDDYS